MHSTLELKKELFNAIKDHYLAMVNLALLKEIEAQNNAPVATTYNAHNTELNFAQLVFHQLYNLSVHANETLSLIAAIYVIIVLQDVDYFKTLQPHLDKLGNEKENVFNHISIKGYFLLHQTQRPEHYGFKRNPEIINLLFKNRFNVNIPVGNPQCYILTHTAELLTKAQKKLETYITTHSLSAITQAQEDVNYYQQILHYMVPYCNTEQLQETLGSATVSDQVKKLIQKE